MTAGRVNVRTSGSVSTLSSLVMVHIVVLSPHRSRTSSPSLTIRPGMRSARFSTRSMLLVRMDDPFIAPPSRPT